MSEKKTISAGSGFNLFEKDKNNVYIELEDITECCFEIWEVSSGDTSSRARIKIPKKVWAKMIEDWTNYKRKDREPTE
tara:strand:+ start:288 stop:521 length:234 start_codon:yes stop_codon:yes gene_type:complete